MMSFTLYQVILSSNVRSSPMSLAATIPIPMHVVLVAVITVTPHVVLQS